MSARQKPSGDSPRESPELTTIDPSLSPRAMLGIGIAAAVGLVIFAGVRYHASGVVLAFVAIALVLAISGLWGSLRTMLGETPLSGADAFALGAPRTEEEQKRAVLRALKDLEFERDVGKISQEDYKVLLAQYRREAKRLLRLLDEATAEERAKAEALVEARMRKLGMATKPVDAKAEDSAEDSVEDGEDKAEPAPEVGDDNDVTAETAKEDKSA